jgi:hypothetical protein
MNPETTTHSARITGPVLYRTTTGHQQKIPIGPCLVEGMGGLLIDVIWGLHGQRSTVMPAKEMQVAQKYGYLVLID